MGADFPGETLGEIFHARCAEAPAARSCWFKPDGAPPISLNRAKLRQRAGLVAGHLRARGVAPGEIVIIVLEHSPDLLAAFWGAILAGAVPSILASPQSRVSREYFTYTIGALTELIRPRLLISRSELLVGVTTELPLLDPARLAPLSDPGVAAVRSDDLVLLQHSSGTTGLQKGVALTHRAVIRQVREYAAVLAVAPSDVIASWLPLYHDMGLIACLVLPTLTGIPFTMMSPFEWIARPVEIIRLMHHHRATLAWFPNFAFTVLARFVRDEDLAGLGLGSLRGVINCSEPVTFPALDEFARRFAPCGLRREALGTCYAMAENTFAVTQTPPGRFPATVVGDAETFAREHRLVPTAPAAGRVFVSSGPPLPNCQVAIRAVDGNACPAGTVGEIVLRSDCMLREYFRRPDATAAALADGWYRTGDLGFLHDGELYVTGRQKDLLIVGGQNYYPHDLETVTGDLPGLKPGRAVCIGIADELLATEEIVVIAETAAPVTRATAGELGRRVKTAVYAAIGCRVKKVLLVAANTLPKSTSGKLARALVRERYLAGDYDRPAAG